MNKIHAFLVSLVVVFFSSCDKVENAYKPAINTDLNTSYYPGSWADYEANEWPAFAQNTNTLRNVLIEDYTGHTCNNCPTAAITAHDLEIANPNRVFATGIHAGPGGMTNFQNFTPSADKFYTNHTNEHGLAYGLFFQNGYNFFGNPQGTVNRATVANKMFDLHGTWASRVGTILADTDLKFNLQAVVNFYEETKGGYLHVEIEKITSAAIETNMVVYVVRNEQVDWQKMPNNSDNPDYVHEHKHLGNIDNQTWGRPLLTGSLPAGDKVYENYDFALPEGLNAADIHFLVYVYDVISLEILQVIKVKLE
jgi:hypothetical protein